LLGRRAETAEQIAFVPNKESVAVGVEFHGHAAVVKAGGKTNLCRLGGNVSHCIPVVLGESYLPVLGDGSVGVIKEDGSLVLYDQVGERRASLPPTNFNGNFALAFNSRCRSAFMWTEDGRVRSFRRRLTVLGKPIYDLDGTCR